MRGESKKNSSKRRSFILSLFFPGWNEMLQFWALGKDVYSTLNKTEVYFKMKHHLKLLWKRPNKKHLHFFQNPFPIFLLLFFFFPLNWNECLWSAWIHKTFQSSDFYNISGKKLLLASSLLPSAATSQEAERNQSPGEMSGLSQGRGSSRTMMWSTQHTSTWVSTSQSRQKKVQGVSFPTWSRMNALWTPTLVVPLLLLRTTTSVSLWWKRNRMYCIQSSTHRASSFWHLTWDLWHEHIKVGKCWMGFYYL